MATQEFGGNPCSIGTRNCRHPDQWPISSIIQMRLNIRMKTLAMLRNCNAIRTAYYGAICAKVSLIKTQFYGKNSNTTCRDSVESYQHAVGLNCKHFCKRNIYGQHNNLHEQQTNKQMTKTQVEPKLQLLSTILHYYSTTDTEGQINKTYRSSETQPDSWPGLQSSRKCCHIF